MYDILITKTAEKDLRTLKEQGLSDKVVELLKVIKKDPYKSTPTVRRLVGGLSGYYARRINTLDQLVYSVNEKSKSVYVLTMKTN